KESEKTETRGRKPEYITLTVNCFKKLCLKSRTKKADEVHDYFIFLEYIVNVSVVEQSEEFQNRLRIKDQELSIKDQELKLKDIDKQNSLIENFKNKQVLYLIKVSVNIIKYG